ncbi:MAG: NAD-dependent epimerase/dehydratase family protein [Candidatus Staskawiczbacteria bacterium]
MKKILILGGAGFIGSTLANKLNSLGYQVAVFDNLSTGDSKNLNQGIKFYLGDISDENKLRIVFEKERPDIVINEAAKVYWKESDKNSILDVSTNIIGTINLLKLCVEYKVGKFIFASTVSVYGGIGKKKVKENTVISLSDVPTGIFSYGATKYLAEKYINFFAKNYSLKYTILRYGHVYGPGQINQKDGISIFIDKIINNDALPIIGSGNQIRDYVYVDDVVDATIKCIEVGENIILNITGGKPVNAKDLVNLFSKIVGKSLTKENIRTTNKDKGLFADVSRAKNKIGWSPKTSLRQKLSNTLDYFKNINK